MRPKSSSATRGYRPRAAVSELVNMDATYSWLRRSVSRLKMTSLPSSSSAAPTPDSTKIKSHSHEENDKIYGITDQLIAFVNSFSLETFKNFSLPDEDEFIGDAENSGKVRRDLSEWQEAHAILALSRIKVLAQLRFRLCPSYLKERQFWRIYFTLVWSFVAEYELEAIKLAKLKQMRIEDDKTISNSNSCEVEMSEAKFTVSMESAMTVEQ